MARFRNLTRAQEEAFERIASEWYRGTESHPRTMAALVRKGLLTRQDWTISDNGRAEVETAWFVPSEIRNEWMEWLQEQVGTGTPPF